MLSTDREEFESQLRKLCAGFDTPYTTDREEAYWSGMQKMTLLQFVRCVDEALGENYFDPKNPATKRIPTTGALWQLHRTARTHATQITQAPRQQVEEKDHILYFANRLFLRHVVNREGLGPAELKAARLFVRQLVAEFQGYVRENDADATPAEFIAQLIRGLETIGTIGRETLIGWQRQARFPHANQPFPAFMARQLPVESQRELVPT